jgi:hypothetical protein
MRLKFAKRAKMTQKMFPPDFMMWVSKNAELCANLKCVAKWLKKISKSFTHEKTKNNG